MLLPVQRFSIESAMEKGIDWHNQDKVVSRFPLRDHYDIQKHNQHLVETTIVGCILTDKVVVVALL